MKRRSFVKNSVATLAATASAASLSTAADLQQASKEYYELRVYQLKSGGKLSVFEEYLSKAVIPALNNIGINNIGVFTEMGKSDPPKLYMLIPYQSLEQFASAEEKIKKQAVYQDNSKNYMSATSDNPNFIRIYNYLLEAFDVIPKMKVPEKGERIFELRDYESFSEEAGMRKVEMFNKDEMDIFYKTGLDPVFFGKTMVGQDLPNLIYMLVFDNIEERDANWKKFSNHPDWKRVSGMEKYANTVSQVKRTFLLPTSYSQI
ncbi:NIPSNAP family protein [Porifericola rhodea]|uniref:NIPSNAP family protein n=1 Tax=Porifericola rhodea TaxID=930972 RepID=UPI002666330B|nr:NIPSNAP family protein [Porifericola rhodea]WKN33246.1 NIPSNAP family protein [Porifericola rhodea]